VRVFVDVPVGARARLCAHIYRELACLQWHRFITHGSLATTRVPARETPHCTNIIVTRPNLHQELVTLVQVTSQLSTRIHANVPMSNPLAAQDGNKETNLTMMFFVCSM